MSKSTTCAKEAPLQAVFYSETAIKWHAARAIFSMLLLKKICGQGSIGQKKSNLGRHEMALRSPHLGLFSSKMSAKQREEHFCCSLLLQFLRKKKKVILTAHNFKQVTPSILGMRWRSKQYRLSFQSSPESRNDLKLNRGDCHTHTRNRLNHSLTCNAARTSWLNLPQSRAGAVQRSSPAS